MPIFDALFASDSKGIQLTFPFWLEYKTRLVSEVRDAANETVRSAKLSSSHIQFTAWQVGSIGFQLESRFLTGDQGELTTNDMSQECPASRKT